MNKFSNCTLISDLDGTLLNDDGTVSYKNLKAIEYFKSEGGKFTVATGRIINRTHYLTNVLKLDLPGIFSNGATIATLDDKKVLWERNMNDCAKDVICDFHNRFKDYGIVIFSEDKDYFINPDIYKKINSDLSGFNICESKIEDIETPFYKIVIVSENNILDILNREYKPYLDRIYFTKSHQYYYEIVDKSINKGRAVDILKEIACINNNKIITIGDNLNDMELVEKGDIGAAVLNGCEPLIKKAKITVDKEDALYNLISKLS